MFKWLYARPVSTTLVVPGVERTREHPAQPAAVKLLGDAQNALRPRRQREPDRAEVMKVSGRATADAPSNMERPGASKLRRRVAAYSPPGLIPSAFPAPMSSFLTCETSGEAVPLDANQPRGGMHPINYGQASTVLEAAPDPAFNDSLDTAQSAFEAAAREHLAAPDAQTQITLRAAAEALDAALSSAQLRNLGAAARMHTATRVRLDFAVSELDRILARLAAEGTRDASALEESNQQRTSVKAAAEGARQIQAHYDTALNRAEHRLMDLMVSHPPGFKATGSTAELSAQLRVLADRLPDQPLKEAMSRTSQVEAVSRMLALVTAGDTTRAAHALAALMDTPVLTLMSDTGSDGTGQDKLDAMSLHRLMSGLYGGTNVLMLAAGGDATAAAFASQSIDVQAFWRAERALQKELAQPVRAWLEGAKRAALASVQHGPDVVASQRDLAALRAVRMGFISNAPDSHYGRVNKRLTKIFTKWVDRAQAPEQSFVDRMQHVLGAGGPPAPDVEQGPALAAPELEPPTSNPFGRKTPFRAGTLERLDTVGGSVGVRTPSVRIGEHLGQAAQALRRAAEQLIEQARARGDTPSPALAIGRAIAVFINEHPDRGLAHRPTAEEMSAIQALARESLPAGATLQMPPADSLLEMAGRAASAMQAVSALAPQPATHEQTQTSALLATAHEHLTVASNVLPQEADARRRVVDYLCANLDSWDLRTRLRATDGGVAGAGLLSNMSISLPAVGQPLITPIASAQVRREAFIDIFHPMQGLQIAAGSIRQAGGELGVTAGPTFSLAEDLVGVRLSGGFKGGMSSTKVDGAILRIRREPGRLPEMIDNLKNVVRDLGKWETLRDENGDPFDDAVSALLARNPKLIISDMSQDTSSSVLEVSASAGFSMGDPHPGRRSVTFGPNASVQLSTERQRQHYVDHSGTVRVLNEEVSTAHHKIRASTSLTLNAGDPNNYPHAPRAASVRSSSTSLTPHSSAAPAAHAALAGVKGPAALSGTREFGQDYERASVTVLEFPGTLDADHDRYYNSPDPLLAEVELNREQWIQRYLETLSGWTDAQKEAQGRDLAHRDLDRFLEQAQELQSSNFALYNIHDTMMPQAAGHFQTLYMLHDVAKTTDNQDMAQLLKADRDQLLNEPSTWRRSTMNLFERGRSSATDGVNLVVRAGLTRGADAQLQIAEYPSRNPAPPPQD